MNKLIINVPFSKIDEENWEVWGYATLETIDKQNEIVGYEASKKAFEKFAQQAMKMTDGESKGNIREMHQSIAVGKMIQFQFDDAKKGIYIGTKVSKGAPSTWQKVKEKVLTGYSIGADFANRVPMEKNGKIVNFVDDYNLCEISLVDNPACPGANINVIKAKPCASVVSLPVWIANENTTEATTATHIPPSIISVITGLVKIVSFLGRG